jgi:CheY-like chemotaxis protein
MSLEREARILIVDDQREIARVLRTALELSNRGYFVIDVPSGEEALLELGRVEFDVLVTDYRLPGMSGPELLRRVRKVRPAIKALLITGLSLSEVNSEIKDLDIFRIFEKPIDTSAFTEAVNVAIYGEQPVETAGEGAYISAGPAPEFDEAGIRSELSRLNIDLGARGVAFVNQAGNVLIKEGGVDDVPRFGELAMLLANNFTTTAEISTYLGDQPSTAVLYFDGNWYDVYALSVGVHFFMTILYPGGSQKQMGPVLRYGKPAVANMIAIIGAAAAGIQPGEEVEEAARKPEGRRAEKVRESRKEVRLVEPEEEIGEPFAIQMEVAEVEAVDIDLGDLESALGEDLGDLDSFWEEAGATVTTRSRWTRPSNWA